MNRLVSFAILFSFVTYGMDQEALITRERYSFKDSLEEHKNSIGSIEFNPTDSNELISNSMDGTIKIWDINASSCKKTFNKETTGNNLAVSYDGRYIAYGQVGPKICIIDKEECNTQTIHCDKNNFRKIVFHPKNSSRIVSVFCVKGDQPHNIATIFNLKKDNKDVLKNNDKNEVLKFYDASDFALDPIEGSKIIVSSKRSAKIYNIETQEFLEEIHDVYGAGAVSFNPQNSDQCIFYKSSRSYAQIYDMRVGKVAQSFYIHKKHDNKEVRKVAIHPEGKEIIATTVEKTHFFDITGKFIDSLSNEYTYFKAIGQKCNKIFAKEKQKYPMHTKDIKDTVSSPNGNVMATYSIDENAIKIHKKKN